MQGRTAIALLAALATAVTAMSPARACGVPRATSTRPPASDIAALYAVASVAETRGFALDAESSARASVDFAEAARLFERVAQEAGSLPRAYSRDYSHAYWRAARASWLLGESLPPGATEQKLANFRRAIALSDRGLEANPQCAGCMLWKFTAMGRMRTTAGIWKGIRQVKDMARLLDRGIELQPSYRDGEDNSTLGNLHYSSAIFYRLVPEWWWIRWVIGVKGDKDRALAHSRSALALHPNRLDYQIEVGTQLLCIGTSRGDRTSLQAGFDELRDAVARGAANSDELREIEFAHLMLERPDVACGYSGDQILEVDEESARDAST